LYEIITFDYYIHPPIRKMYFIVTYLKKQLHGAEERENSKRQAQDCSLGKIDKLVAALEAAD
jgi:hypothetical protein